LNHFLTMRLNLIVSFTR